MALIAEGRTPAYFIYTIVFACACIGLGIYLAITLLTDGGHRVSRTSSSTAFVSDPERPALFTAAGILNIIWAVAEAIVLGVLIIQLIFWKRREDKVPYITEQIVLANTPVVIMLIIIARTVVGAFAIQATFSGNSRLRGGSYYDVDWRRNYIIVFFASVLVSALAAHSHYIWYRKCQGFVGFLTARERYIASGVEQDAEADAHSRLEALRHEHSWHQQQQYQYQQVQQQQPYYEQQQAWQPYAQPQAQQYSSTPASVPTLTGAAAPVHSCAKPHTCTKSYPHTCTK
ncbi:hypothetical protein V8E36_003689 [Tilletia maclaganii]